MQKRWGTHRLRNINIVVIAGLTFRKVEFIQYNCKCNIRRYEKQYREHYCKILHYQGKKFQIFMSVIFNRRMTVVTYILKRVE